MGREHGLVDVTEGTRDASFPFRSIDSFPVFPPVKEGKSIENVEDSIIRCKNSKTGRLFGDLESDRKLKTAELTNNIQSSQSKGKTQNHHTFDSLVATGAFISKFRT